MISALVLAAATTALNFSGMFPEEIKTIGVVMPASIQPKRNFDRGVAALEAAGYRVKLAPRLSFDKLAPVEDRVKDFEEAWMDPEVDLVLCARGGTGAQDVIVKLDWEKLRTRPNQRVLGFSNITMILNAMLKEKAGHPFSGPTISQMLYGKGDTFEWLCRAVAGKPQPPAKLRALKAGAFSGLPCGGHIALVKCGIDMKWNADAKGRVVFLERNPSTTVGGIRRELDAILSSGFLDGAAGVIFGDVTPGGAEKGEKGKRKLPPEELAAARVQVDEIKRDFAARAGCPVYDGYAYGHIAVSHAIDFRRRVSVAEDGTMTWEDAAAPSEELKLLAELVAIPSESRNIPEVNRAQRHMKAWLEAKGVACTLETMPDGHELLFAATQPGKEQDYVFAAHLDVVPGRPEQYAMKRDGDRLTGRGVSDCKGPCVAVTKALLALRGKASVGIVFGADEEIGGLTTRWMVERGYRPRKMAIVPDSASSWNAVTYAQKGHTYFTVTAKGKGGHSSRPWLAKDPIVPICEAYLKLRAAWDEANPIPEDQWSDVLSATFLKADGGALNRIPDEASFVVNLRGISPDSADRAEAFIRETTGLEVTRGEDSKPFATDPDHPLVAKLRAAMRRQYPGEEIPLRRMPAATDARCFYDCGVPVAVIGVRGGGAYSVDEWESVSGIDQAAAMLTDFVCCRR